MEKTKQKVILCFSLPDYEKLKQACEIKRLGIAPFIRSLVMQNVLEILKEDQSSEII